MNDTRRGFLKTLGKLGAVLGLTAAACSAHHHGHHGGHQPPKARKRTAPKAKLRPDPVVTFGDAPNVPNGRYGAGFTGFKKAETAPLTYEAMEESYEKAVQAPGEYVYAGNVTVTNRPSVKTAVEATSRYQEWLNRITMAQLDNISETLRIPVLLKDLSD